jgi:hypothetical protein
MNRTKTSQVDSPIYAALVREWQADDRMLPGERDAQWTILTLVSPAMTGQLQEPASAPRPGRWERVVTLSPGHRAELVTTR